MLLLRRPLFCVGCLSPQSAAATAATLALPTGVGPYQQLITTNQGQILQVMRAPNGAQYILQPQQQVVLQQMQPGGVQAPVIQQVLTPLQGGIPQQTGVIIQPQQIVLAGNKVAQNTQVMQATAMTAQASQGAVQIQPQQQAAPPQAQTQQPQQQQAPAQQPPPMMLQVDGAGDTSSEEDEEEEDEYDEDEDEDKDKDGGEDGQVEEVRHFAALLPSGRRSGVGQERGKPSAPF
uniref:General transcription factor IIA, 1 n=1 Tax=Paramormyrops kingsleyae TaxID=1676925 RepID=A0A3B3SQ67_9TELE